MASKPVPIDESAGQQGGCVGKLTAVLRSERVKKEFFEFVSAVRQVLSKKPTQKP